MRQICQKCRGLGIPGNDPFVSKKCEYCEGVGHVDITWIDGKMTKTILYNELPQPKDVVTDTLILTKGKQPAVPSEVSPGYHINSIPKGILGDFSKIKEEVTELEDAIIQDTKIMQAVELSDLIGAIEAYAGKHLSLSLEEVIKFQRITKRAFQNGHRL